MELRGKNCLVIGAGKSGLAAARLLAGKGATVVVNDKAELGHLEFHEAENITLRGGGHNDDIFKNQDLIVLSPGVPANVKPLSDLLAQAEVEGAEIISEIELASRYVKAPIIAVGGTNGKSTTTTLLANMLELGGKKVFSGGNLGTPFCQHVLNDEEADIIVLEVSSFQLERIKTLRPFISILLNISADHLDRYKSMEEYIDAKNRVFMNQCSSDYAVINGEDESVRQLSSAIRAGIVPFGVKTRHSGGVYMSNNYLTSEIEG
ncbi:MAG: UDP-N-acetylmuramoyl-L-alanine--D-glutamate ligase, partial [Proteobacteria bacterium]|nr:UDP-N-acetylmuramoyl-L-alanine--D-glutamate ligase [Pseudomonadota bacterium]